MSIPVNPFRSVLFVPANKQKFVEKAYTRNADAIILDLEDAVEYDAKPEARRCIKDDIPLVLRGGGKCWVRINADSYKEDLDACILPGVTNIFVPKVEDVWTLIDVEETITKLEAERGIPYRTVRTHLAFETAKGYLRMEDCIAASKRAFSACIGQEDFSKDVGFVLEKGDEMLHWNREMVTMSIAYGIKPMGLVGSIADFGDLEGFAKIVEASKSIGITGAFCIHPKQVDVLNKGFAPRADIVEHAKKVVETYEAAAAQGLGAVQLDGKMLDLPVVNRERAVLSRVKALEEWEAYKASQVALAKS